MPQFPADASAQRLARAAILATLAVIAVDIPDSAAYPA